MFHLSDFTTDVEVHQKLGDNPNTDNGLSAAAIKALFDLPAKELKAFINSGVIPFVNQVSDNADAAYTTASTASENAKSALDTAEKAMLAARQAANAAGSGTQVFEYGKSLYSFVMVAANAGKSVFCKRDSVVLPMVSFGSGGILFAGVTDAVAGTIEGYYLSSGNTWFAYRTAYEKTEVISEDSTHEQVPTAKAVWDAIGGLLKDVADLKYVPIDITSVANSIGTVELGKSIPEITLTWVVNKAPASQTVEGEAVDAAARSTVLTGPFASSKTFTVTATDERDAKDTATTKIYFYNGVYYGALASGVVPDSAAVLALTRKLQSGRAATINYTPADGKRPSYACPTRYGTPKFVIGGFEYEWAKLGTIDFANGSGHTESYDIWQHPQDVTAAMTITVG